MASTGSPSLTAGTRMSARETLSQTRSAARPNSNNNGFFSSLFAIVSAFSFLSAFAPPSSTFSPPPPFSGPTYAGRRVPRSTRLALYRLRARGRKVRRFFARPVLTPPDPLSSPPPPPAKKQGGTRGPTFKKRSSYRPRSKLTNPLSPPPPYREAGERVTYPSAFDDPSPVRSLRRSPGSRNLKADVSYNRSVPVIRYRNDTRLGYVPARPLHDRFNLPYPLTCTPSFCPDNMVVVGLSVTENGRRATTPHRRHGTEQVDGRIPYDWVLTAAAWNRLMHSLNGNIACFMAWPIPHVQAYPVFPLAFCLIVGVTALLYFLAGPSTAVVNQPSHKNLRGRVHIRTQDSSTPTSVTCFLVSGERVLLATRGPLSSVPEIRGTLSGIGGKVDPDDVDMSAALDREVKEEVGIDISKFEAIPTYTQTSPNQAFVNLWFVVFCDGVPTPSVPAAEVGKIVDPTWIPFVDVDLSLFNSDSRAAYSASLPYFYRGLESKVSGPASSKWIRRDGRTPPGFDVLMINNKDRLCPAYTIKAVTGRDLDFAALDARLGPGDSYSIQELIPSHEVNEWAAWNSATREWVVGDPTRAKYHYMWSPNGSYGHIDGLRPSANPSSPVDEIYYPTGRSPVDYDYDTYPAPVHTWARSAISADMSESQAMDVLISRYGEFASMDIDGRNKWLKLHESMTTARGAITPITEPEQSSSTTKLAMTTIEDITPVTPRTHYQASYGTKRDLKIKPFTNAGRAAIDVSNDGTLWRAGNLDIISLVSLKRSVARVFSDRSELFTSLDFDQQVTYGSASKGTENLINLLYTGAKNRLVNITANVPYGSVTINAQMRAGAGYVDVREIVSQISGYGFHREIVLQNVVPQQYADKYSQIEKEMRGIFYNLTESNVVTNTLVNLLTSTDEISGVNMVEWYERLWAMSFAARTGCTPRAVAAGRRPVPGAPGNAIAGQSPEWYALFPNNQGFSDMMDVYNFPGAAAARAPLANYPSPRPIDGVSGCTMLPFRRYSVFSTPPIDAIGVLGRRDWRVALYHCTRPYLDMESPATVHPLGGARTDGNLRATSPYITTYNGNLPPLVFLSNEVGTVRLINYDIGALTNPQSAIDAVAFLLQNFGGSADCMTAFSNVLRRCGRFFHIESTVLPSPTPIRYTTGNLIRQSLRKRLVFMRVIRPLWADFTAPARLDINTVRTFKLFSASVPAGVDLTRAAATGAGGAVALAILANVYAFPAFAAANVPPTFATAVPLPAASFAHIDVLWHNYFLNTVIDGTVDDPLWDFIDTMPRPDFDSMLLWLAEPFVVGRWGGDAATPTAAMLGGLADWVSPINNRAGRAIIAADRPTALAAGVLFRRESILPLTNGIEIRQVSSPSGVRLLRSIKSSQSMFHSDDAALTLADRLVHGNFEDVFGIGILLQVQMRAGVDVAVGQLGISPAYLALLEGRPVTGDPALDTIFTTTNDYDVIGGADLNILSFWHAVSLSLESSGLPSTWADELSSNVVVEHMPWAQYHYRRGGYNDYDGSLTVLRCLSPMTVAFFRPELNAPGSLVVKKPDVFSTLTPTSVLPWDEWVIGGNELSAEEPFGVLRVVCANSGHRIIVTPALRRVDPTGNADPIIHPILTRYGRVGPSVPWQTPTMENSAVEPLWFISAPLGYRIRTETVGGVYHFIESGPIHAYHTLGRINGLPSVIVYSPNMINALVGTDVNRQPVSAFSVAISDYAADGHCLAVRENLAGLRPLDAAGNVLAPDGTLTATGDRLTRVLSGQASSNTTWMRNTPGLLNANAATTAQFGDRTRLCIDGDGQAPPIGWIAAGGATEGVTLTSFGSNLFTVPYGQPWADPDALRELVLSSPMWTHRWNTWYIELKPGALPVLLSPLEQYASGLGIPVLDHLSSGGLLRNKPLHAQSSLSKSVRARMGLVTPDEGDRVDTFDNPIVSVPTQRLDTRHINTGFSAINGQWGEYTGRPPAAERLNTTDPSIEIKLLEDQIALLKGQGLTGHGLAPPLKPLRTRGF